MVLANALSNSVPQKVLFSNTLFMAGAIKHCFIIVNDS